LGAVEDALDNGVSVPLVWVDLDAVSVEMANQFVSQFEPDQFILTVGQVAPPMIIGSEEERLEQLRRISYAPVRTLARVSMSPARMRELVSVLQQSLQHYEQAFGGKDNG